MKRDRVGDVPVKCTGNALYLTMGGGTFDHDGVKGSFAATSNGVALVIYIDDGKSYQVDVQDMIKLAVKHHKRHKR